VFIFKPIISNDPKEISDHRAIKKEMVYYLNFTKGEEVEENYSSDCMEYKTVMGKEATGLKEFVENSLILFADIIEIDQCSFDIFSELATTNNIEDQEKIIFKHLLERVK